MSPENKSIRKQVILVTKKTLESSSLHAVPNIVSRESTPLRLIWSACLLASLGLCGLNLFRSISDYLCYKTVTNVYINNLNQQQFPVVSICNYKNSQDDSSGLNLENIWAEDIRYLQQKINITNDLEFYKDPSYGTCVRFNSGQNMNGSSVPFKYVNNRGWLNSLVVYVRSSIVPLIWISNETISSIENEGILITPGLLYYIKIKKYSIFKQPFPYSSCTNNLAHLNSYDSECYRKTFSSSNRTSYHYKSCTQMCRQKYLGEFGKSFKFF